MLFRAKSRKPFSGRRLWLTNLEERLTPASFQVTTTADSGAASLRAAVIAANGSAGQDTITFTGAAFASNATITLTSGEIAVSDSVIIDGAAKGVITLSGNNSSRLFNVNNAVAGSAIDVTLQNMTLTKGATSGVNDGGAIFSQDENLTLINMTITANSSASDGGAIRIEAGGKLTIDTCVVTSNTAAGTGGAFSLAGGPTVTIDDSSFSSNNAVAGGAVNMFQGGSLTVTGCTYNANTTTTSDGGALFLNGTFSTEAIRNSTFSGNFANSDGGAISVGGTGTLNIQNCTIVSNVATVGNGGGIARTAGTQTINLVSTIVFSNGAGTTADNLFSTGTVNGTLCLIANTTGVTTFVGDAFTNANLGVSPQINALANNGGSTQTCSLKAASPAIDAGSNPASLTTDQRGTGYFRTRGVKTDIGAYEVPDDFIVTNTNNSGAGSLRQAVLDANAAVGLDTITFDPTVFATAKTITLTTGELLVTEFLTVSGPTAALTVSGNNAGRVFHAENAAAVASLIISDITITAGKAGIGNDGGAIFTTEPLTLTRVNVTNSSAGDEGGGIRVTSTGSLTMTDCAVSGNAAVTGGALAIDAGASVTIKGSTFSGNNATGSGGAVALLGASPFSITNSTFSGNTAVTGGGVAWTVTGNNNSVFNSTVTGNVATGGKGGGLYAKSGIVNLDSTIASGNTGATGPDIFNTGTTNVNFSAVGSSAGFTLTGANNLAFGTNLLLGVLQNNGGLTKTHAPAFNSPVLGKGSNITGATNDQRGSTFPRVRGTVDIGAVEVDQIIVVNTNGGGSGSLEQAVLDANSNGGRDTITFDPTVFATQKTINTANEMTLTDDVEIQGPEAGLLVSGVLSHRIISITGGSDFDFSNMSFLLGKAAGNGGALLVNATGNQTVTLLNCALSFNSASGTGGAIDIGNDTLNLTDCTLSSNQTTGATVDGGAININSTAAVVLTRCAMSFNTATGDGGSIANQAGGSAVQLFETTLSSNSAGGVGGGVFYTGGAVGTGFLIRNSTLSDNTAGTFGGGIGWNTSSGTLTIQNSTITNNTASTAAGGGGISVNTGTGNLNIESSIVSGNINAGAPDIDNPNTTSVKTSAVGDNLGWAKTDLGGNLPFQPHANLKLGVLANNGGPTLTHLPQAGSPLINSGSNPVTLTGDQRGFPRLLSGSADIGSAEFLNTVVKNTNDSGLDSLRQVIIDTNVSPGAQTITFDSAVFATEKTITLTSGELEILDALTITGPTVGVTISANKNSRVLNIGENLPDFSTSLSNLTLRDGAASGVTNGGAVSVSGGTLTLTNCTLVDNSSENAGGAIAAGVFADVVVVNSTIRENTAAGSGGGIAFTGGLGSLTMSASLVANNSAGLQAGGLLLGSADLSIINSTIAGNTAATNGGGFNITNVSQPIVLRNLTITGNTAATGGGFFMPNALSQSIDSCIVFGNTAVSGPDISYPGTLTVGASLVGSKAGVSTFTGDAFTNSHIGADPLLGPLQDNGGPTLTHLPAFSSPAVNNGSNPSGLTTDQRGAGFARIFGGAIDIGAVETHLFVVTNTNDSGAGSLRQAVLDSNVLAGTDGIVFDPTNFATAKTITLTTGKLTITDSVSIFGPTVGVTVSGNNASGVFEISGSGTLDVVLQDMTVKSSNTRGIVDDNENVSLTRVNVTGNAGGMSTTGGGSLTLINCTVTNNTALGGAGISMGTGGDLTLIDTTIAGNTATSFSGGGVFTSANAVTISGCTIAGNSAKGSGGGILIGANAPGSIRNSTISGNQSGSSGGGIGWNAPASTLNLQNCTVFANTAATSGGNFARIGNTVGGILAVESAIFHSGQAPTAPDIDNTFSASFVTLKNSLVGTTSGANFTNQGGNLIAVNPLLSPLANNGGTTLTHLPAINSPAVDAGSNPAALTTDQRGSGFPRSIGGGVDIGAVETRAFIVRNTNDAGPGSLRQNIIDSNGLAGADTIIFDPTVFATAKTITLTTGQLTPTESLTVSGPSGGVSVSGNNASRVFSCNGNSGSIFNFSNLTIQNGKAVGAGGGIDTTGGTLNVTDCTISNNSASGLAGGINVDPTFTGLTVLRCTVFGNSAGTSNGAISAFAFGSVNVLIQDSSIVGNVAELGCGGADVGGLSDIVIRNSTISGNTAKSPIVGYGGGLSVRTSTGSFLLQNSTVTANIANTNGGGISCTPGTTLITIESSIVYGNSSTGAAEIFMPNQAKINSSLIGSKVGVTTFTGDAFTNANIGVDPLLGPLQDNGGPTLTHLPAPGSKAFNNGSNPGGLTTDQRGSGFIRQYGTAVDIGAVEMHQIVVTNTNNSGAGSLRQAVLDANAASGADTIIFDPTVFATAKTITLTTGVLSISDSVTIQGSVAGVTVSGNNLVSVLNISGAGVIDVSISDLTVTASQTNGISILGDEKVSLQRVNVIGSATGGISTAASVQLSLTNCMITGNKAAEGAGIRMGTNSTLSIVDSTIASNTATSQEGGGIFASITTLTIAGSTISGNSAKGPGGGIYLAGNSTTNIRNSTISGNQSDASGGGIAWGGTVGTVAIQNTTIVANTAANSGGNFFRGSGNGILAVESTIIHGGSSPVAPDIDNAINAPFVTLKSNLIGTTSGTSFTDQGGNLIGVNPLLAPLANNGGPTLTHGILPGSPLINAGSNPAALTTDQRGSGFLRTNSGTIDIGAYESKLPPTVTSVTFGDGTTHRSLIKQLVVNFSEPVTFAGSVASAFTLHRSGTGGTIGDVTLTATPATGTTGSVTLTFSGSLTEFGSLVDGYYDLIASAAQISGANGLLDGNVDGIAGGSYSVVGNSANKFFRLFGDHNADATVNQIDFNAFRLAFLGGPNTVFDFDNDGQVSQADYDAFRLRYLGTP